jgi:hypothetical protein
MQREQPAAQLHLLEAGHFASNDRPDQIAGCVSGFLARLPP